MIKNYVIGDSNVRSFAYDLHLIPLFIGPAAFNNFLSKKKSDHTKDKIKEVCKLLTKNDRLLLTFSGDHYHVGELNDDGLEKLIKAASLYCASVLEIRNSFDGELIVILPFAPTISRKDKIKHHKFYLSELVEQFDKNKINYLNPNKKITTEGTLREYYTMDFAHVSYKYIQHLLDDLESETEFAEINNKPWSYLYILNTKFGPIKIWGDHAKEDLKLGTFDVHYWHTYNQKTLLIKHFCKLINSFLVNSITVDLLKTIHIFDCKEGFVAFELLKNRATKIRIDATDSDEINIERAKILNKFYGYDNLKLEKQIVSPSKIINNNDFIVSFERATWDNKYKKDFFDQAFKSSAVIFFLSYTVKNDSRLLKKAGFQYTYIVKRDCNITEPGDLIIASKEKLSNIGDSKFERIKRKTIDSVSILLEK